MNDETAIRAALNEWGEAFCDKNIDRLMALYAPEAVVFDAIPPFAGGIDTLRAKLIEGFPSFPGDCAVERRDLAIAVGDGLASAHFIGHFTGLPPGHPAGHQWLRSSLTWRRQSDGRWLIVHEHCSAPFDPLSKRVAPGPDSPATADMADGGRNPVGWFEIRVQDMKRARAFYGAVFQSPLTRLDGPVELWSFPMQAGDYGASGALARADGTHSAANGVTVYFSCADCAIELARAVAAGGSVLTAKTPLGQYGFAALVSDTEGNTIGLHSMR